MKRDYDQMAQKLDFISEVCAGKQRNRVKCGQTPKAPLSVLVDQAETDMAEFLWLPIHGPLIGRVCIQLQYSTRAEGAQTSGKENRVGRVEDLQSYQSAPGTRPVYHCKCTI